ncbi:AAA family ATPase [Phytomonospora endophytica]|uniref:DNA-binding CsgD family transcriptional regulator n=1 Tax=Phytomonospora endophytica TaxID=714109 RepID=A0A841FQ72_9ACTN|nr:AAA family ATPase [Phytomonospora endophytica]MBB6038236.1 DNA-binding CsgD family transcriptional regulator [Phytomonospora endophytica]GIG67304.1 hypothetical protein Pen01_35990 [Phytomonospora endophytica]
MTGVLPAFVPVELPGPLNGSGRPGRVVEEPPFGPYEEPVWVPKMETISAAELQTMEFPEPNWAIPGLLPEGLTLFAGSPKLGKSWFVYGAGLHIAAGMPVLGDIEAEQGPVLYLALEDTLRRLQGRMNSILGGTQAPKDFYSTTKCPPFGSGGEEELHYWLGKHPGTRLVIIDTFVKMRAETRSSASVYEADYHAADRIKQIADAHQVAIVVVHHTRKMSATDFQDTVSGSNGLAGAADATLVLDRARTANHGTLSLTGRDVEESALALVFDPETGLWGYDDVPAGDNDLTATQLDITRYLRSNPDTSPKDIAEALGLKPDSVRTTCRRMAEKGHLAVDASSRYPVYRAAREADGGEGRSLSLLSPCPSGSPDQGERHPHKGTAEGQPSPAVPQTEV